MNQILKKSDQTSESLQNKRISEWRVTGTDEERNRRKRIIKAKEANFNASEKKLSHMNMPPPSPVVKPIRNGLFIEGVEVFCRCGEEIVIHFDADDNG